MREGLGSMAFDGKINSILKNMQTNEIKELLDRLELMGNTDIARQLGWSSSKVTNYVKRGILPEPITTIGGRPAWTKAQIDYFIKTEKGSWRID